MPSYLWTGGGLHESHAIITTYLSPSNFVSSLLPVGGESSFRPSGIELAGAVRGSGDLHAIKDFLSIDKSSIILHCEYRKNTY